MRVGINLLVAAISLFFISCHNKSEITQDFFVIVNSAPFENPQDAAAGERRVDWSGNDLQKQSACTESFAALELQTYLKKLSFNIDEKRAYPVINAGDKKVDKYIRLWNLSRSNPDDELTALINEYGLKEKLNGSESFAIIGRGDKMYIIGYDRVGTLYGVYALLEKLGVHWYEPGEKGEVVVKPLKLQVDYGLFIDAPKFVTRGFWVWEDRSYKDFYLWMARNKLNFWTIAEPHHAFLQKLGIQLTVGGHLHFNKFLNPDAEYPYNHPNFRGDEYKPADPYAADSPEYIGDANHDGKLSYFEAHPEWYGLYEGRRRGFGKPYKMNICTSNDDVIKELNKKLIHELADGAWRDASSLNFWPLDGGEWCRCDNCKPLGTPSDRMILLAYRVQKALAQAQKDGVLKRNIKVIFPIYHETLPPPTKPLPQDFDYDNTIGTFFPIHRCYVHALNDTNCTEYNVPIWNDFLGWAQKKPHYYKGQFFIGEYYNVSGIKSLPVLYMKIMSKDIPVYYKYGVRHAHYMHVYTRLLGMKRINNYLFAKLLWNPDADSSDILTRYYNDIYGKSARDMERLYSRMEYAMSAVKQWKHSKPLTDRIYFDRKPLFNLEHLKLKEYHPQKNDGVDLEESVIALKECRKIMNKVLQVPGLPIDKIRLLEDDKNLKYAENTVNFYYYFSQAIEAERAGERDSCKRALQKCIPFAKGLQRETDIVQTAASHANAPNGLKAARLQTTFFNVLKAYDVKY